MSVVTAPTCEANEGVIEIRHAARQANPIEDATTQIAQSSVSGTSEPFENDFCSSCEGLKAEIMGLRTEILEQIPADQVDQYSRLSQKLEDLAIIYSRTIDGTEPIHALDKDLLELKQTIAELVPHSVDKLMDQADPAQRSEWVLPVLLFKFNEYVAHVLISRQRIPSVREPFC